MMLNFQPNVCWFSASHQESNLGSSHRDSSGGQVENSNTKSTLLFLQCLEGNLYTLTRCLGVTAFSEAT